ncbi:histidine kinase [bacterium SCSIO 12741]|nr:histidine kinase [bacterium SCSIO 12741]
MPDLVQRVLLFGLSFLLAMKVSSAQELVYFHYTTDNGLPAMAVHDVEADSVGNLWFATEKGVSCFDGVKFKNFSTEDGIPDNLVFEIRRSPNGRMWFIPLSSRIFYFENDEFHYYSPADTLWSPEARTSYFVDFYTDAQNRVKYYSHEIGLAEFDPFGKVRISLPPDRLNSMIMEFEQVSQDKFIYKRSGRQSTSNLLVIKTPTRKDSIPIPKFNPSFRAYYEILDDGSVLFSHGSHLFRFTSDTLYQLSDLQVRINAIKSFDNQVWIGTGNGLIQAEILDNDSLRRGPTFFLGNRITSILKDFENGFWITSENNGVYYVPDLNQRMFTQNSGLAESEQTSVLTAPNKLLYSGSAQGNLQRIDLKSGTIQTIRRQSASDLSVDHIALGKDHVYFSTLSGSLFFFHQEDPLFNLHKISKAPDSSDLLLKFITRDPLSEGIIAGGVFRIFKIQQDNIKVLSWKNDIRFIHIIPLEQDQYLFGTLRGVYHQMEIQEGPNNEIPAPIYSGIVVDLGILENYIPVIGSQNEGLLLYRNNRLDTIGLKEGLSSMHITDVLVQDSTIWVASTQGLDRIDISNLNPLKYTIENFDRFDGIPSNHIHQMDTLGRGLVMATRGGLSLFVPETKKPPPPRCRVRCVKLGKSPSYLEQHAELSETNRDLSFEFDGISFRSSQHLQFKYKLKGYDQDYKYTTNREIQYTNLPYGSYEFELYVANKHGVWSTQPSPFYFSLTPPFWLTWWFFSLEIVGLLILLFFLFSWRLRKLTQKVRKQEAIRREKAELELKALRSQMNPHFTFNALNSIQSYISSDHIRESKSYLAKFARLNRTVLESSDKLSISLQDELDLVTRFIELEQLRFERKLQFDLHLDESIDPEWVKVPPLILQPFIENSVVHGMKNKPNGGAISIDIKKQEDFLICIIRDNGSGINEADTKLIRKSMGLSITQKRLDLLNGQGGSENQIRMTNLERATNGKMKGTQVELRIRIIP